MRQLGQNGGRIDQYRTPHLSGNGARCASVKVRSNRLLLKRQRGPNSDFAIGIDSAAGTRWFVSFAVTESANTEADSTLKELQRVKTDAQNARSDEQKARASEAAVRHKLADAEVDLKRAKEEAARATKEAQQAKTDAKAAQEAKAGAERKLADAEAAQSAAEERLKASESAAKNQGGFGARLRGWFGHKPPNQ